MSPRNAKPHLVVGLRCPSYGAGFMTASKRLKFRLWQFGNQWTDSDAKEGSCQ